MGLDMFVRCSDEELIGKVMEKAKPHSWFLTGMGDSVPVMMAQFDDNGNVVGFEPYKLREDIHEEELVAYWRKELIIHLWFVDHVQRGRNDQGWYRLTFDQLRQLREWCLKGRIVMETLDLLPEETSEDREYTIENLRYTVEWVNAIESETQVSDDGKLVRPKTGKEVVLEYGSWW